MRPTDSWEIYEEVVGVLPKARAGHQPWDVDVCVGEGSLLGCGAEAGRCLLTPEKHPLCLVTSV